MAKFFGKSRSEKRAENNLGIKRGTLAQSKNAMFRKESLNEICKYLDSAQYDHLADWDISEESEEHVALRRRKPKIIFPFASILAERVASKLLGKSTFPKLEIEQDPDTKELMDLVIKSSYFKSLMLKASETFVSHNSVFIRFKITAGNLFYEYYNPKYCYPVFDEQKELESIDIKYVYDDNEDLDGEGRPIKKWYKLTLSKTADTLFNNPLYASDQEPTFEVVKSNAHNVGFVQGEWIVNGYDNHSPDGDKKTIIEKAMPFMDALNYNLSQSDKAVLYGQDPQLAIAGMDEDEVESLIKSSSKGWNLGREGTANFLEISGSGVSTGKEHREDIKRDVQDIARVIMLDPEKIVGSAQSAKAMEVLHGPLVELINQLRPHMEKGLIKLMQKSIALLVLMNRKGNPTVFNIPPNYVPASLDITAIWPPIFQPTTQDKQQIIGMMIQLSSGNILSRETVLKNLLAMIPEIEVDDLELEIQRINTQKEFNSFAF